MRTLRLLPLAVVAAGVLLGVTALLAREAPASAAPEDDIEAALLAAILAWNNNDFRTLAAAFTDDGLADQFGITDRSQAEDQLAEAFSYAGPIPSLIDQIDAVDLSDIAIAGEHAVGIVEFSFLGGFTLYEQWEFEMIDGDWKVGAGKAVTRPVPDGVRSVDLALKEYGYDYDKSAAAAGNIAFNVTNTGTELHEVVVFRLTTDAPLAEIGEALLAGGLETTLPPGVEYLSFGGLFEPGDNGTGLFNEPLANGRYMLVCFVSTAGAPTHVALGMASEFTVTGEDPSGAGSASSSAGDDSGMGNLVWVAIAVVAVLGVIGVAMWRETTRA